MMNSFFKRRLLIRKTKEQRMTGQTCPQCKKKWEEEHLRKTLYTCPYCGTLLQMPAWERLHLFFDDVKNITGSYNFRDPIHFPNYADKIRSYQKKTDLKEAIVIATCKLQNQPLVTGVMDSRFLMASMGTFVGAQIVKAFEIATEKRLPVVLFCASGGARMQEGIYSLMQMVKTSNAVREHSNQGLLYISVMTHPTTGGVTASFASLGDIILAEKNALIGFAGQRVIKNTIHEELPEGFQSAEYLEENGFLDGVYERNELKDVLEKILAIHR